MTRLLATAAAAALLADFAFGGSTVVLRDGRRLANAFPITEITAGSPTGTVTLTAKDIERITVEEDGAVVVHARGEQYRLRMDLSFDYEGARIETRQIAEIVFEKTQSGDQWEIPSVGPAWGEKPPESGPSWQSPVMPVTPATGQAPTPPPSEPAPSPPDAQPAPGHAPGHAPEPVALPEPEPTPPEAPSPEPSPAVVPAAPAVAAPPSVSGGGDAGFLGLYHASSAKQVGADVYEWRYDFTDPREHYDFLEMDGGGLKGYGHISGGKFHTSGRDQPDTVLRTAFYLNAVFRIKNVEMELETHSVDKDGGPGATLGKIMACPDKDVWSPPAEWDLEKYKYDDNSTHNFRVDGGRSAIASGTFAGGSGPGAGPDRKILFAWEPSGNLTLTCNGNINKSKQADSVPCGGGDKGVRKEYCIIGFGDASYKGIQGEAPTFDWVRFKGAVPPDWIAFVKKYGLPPVVNCARAGASGGARHGSMNYQSGSRVFRSHRQQLGGPEAQWKWLKANPANYLYYSHGVQDDEWEKIKSGGALPRSS